MNDEDNINNNNNNTRVLNVTVEGRNMREKVNEGSRRERRLVNVDEFTTKLHRRRSKRGTPYYCDYV